jgi:hypothetical protein
MKWIIIALEGEQWKKDWANVVFAANSKSKLGDETT